LAKINTNLLKSAKNKKNHIIHQNTLPTSYHNIFYLAFSNSYHKKSINISGTVDARDKVVDRNDVILAIAPFSLFDIEYLTFKSENNKR
jgi:hypothetical protein